MMTTVKRADDLAELHRDHYRSLVRLAYALLDDLGQSEEVVQEAFARVLAGGQVRDPEATLSYVRTTVVNLARSGLRRRQVARRHLQPVPDELVHLNEGQRDVIDALRKLPRRQRECVVLRFWGDLSEVEIATTMGVSPGSVKTHASRGLAALARLLDERS